MRSIAQMAPCLLAFALCPSTIAASAAPPGPAKDRSASDAESPLAREAEMIRKDRIAEAERSFRRKLASQKSPKARADLIGAFGIELVQNAPKLDDAIAAKILDYLDQAVDAYRLTLGVDDPEVATALVRRAEVERMLHPEQPAEWTDMAYEQAYRIRFRRLGGSSLVTLSTLIPMAELKASPSRAKGDPAEIEAAAALLRQVIETAASSRDDQAEPLRAEALDALKRLDTAYGDGQPGNARPQILTAGAAQQCATTDLRDAIIFSGDPGPLATLRDRFTKAKLDLRPCGSMLIFHLAPGVDPTPVLDLLTDISAGRMKGVRMGLGRGDDTPDLPDQGKP